jgi:hypothetical protein
MIAWPRTVLRLQRFELLALALVTVAWAFVASFLVWQMGGFTQANPECFADFAGGPHCSDILDAFAPWEQAAQFLLAVVVAAPFAIGLILGVPVVAAEIERGTAQIAWSLSLSRVRWLAWRALPLLVVATLMLLVYAVGGEFLVRGRLGMNDPGFLSFGDRGLLIVVRGLMILSLAVLIGAWIGRTLPGLLVAAALAGLITFGLNFGLDSWRSAEAVVETDQQFGRDPDLLRGLYLGQVAVLPDGSVTRDRHVDRLPAEYEEGFLILPASTFWSWTLREGAILILMGAGTSVLLTDVLRRRRPL